MMKTSLLLISLITLTADNVLAFGNNETLVCYFHETVYNIEFVEGNQHDPASQCGLPGQQLVNNTPEHDIHKRLDVHDPECFSWMYTPAQDN